MNCYETVFILTPVLSDDQAKEAVHKFESDIQSFGGKIKHSERWGLKKLAYPIQKKTTGFYYLIEFEGEGSIILTVKMDADHLAYAEKRRARIGESKPVAKVEAN